MQGKLIGPNQWLPIGHEQILGDVIVFKARDQLHTSWFTEIHMEEAALLAC